MDSEVLLALIFKRVDKRINSLYLPSRGPRGQRGARGEKGENGKGFEYSEHEETIRNLVRQSIPKISDLSAEEISLLRGPRGKDGRDGEDGKDAKVEESDLRRWAQEYALKFEDLSAEQMEKLRGRPGKDGQDGKSLNFADHEGTFKSWAKEFALKFEDLTVEHIEKLRGPRGREGKDGKNFVFDEHKETIARILGGIVADSRDSLRLKFSDLTPEEMDSIRGRPGKDGKDGKNFVFDEHKESISKTVSDLISSIQDSLKLKFNDLSSEDIEKLRGPRGREGRDGKNFVFDEHREFFESLRPKFSDFTKEEIEKISLKFSHLTEEEKDRLKLKFSDLTDEERLKLRGARGSRGQRGREGRDGNDGKQGKQGVRGLPGIQGIRGLKGKEGRDGKDGRDGVDGKDAPTIVNVEIDQFRKSAFDFIFEFSDGTELRVGPVKIPEPVVYSSAGGASAASGGGGSGGGGVRGVALKANALVGVFSSGDTVYTLPQTPISEDELDCWLNGIGRTDYVLAGNLVTFVGQDTTGQVFDAKLRYGVTIESTLARKVNALAGTYDGSDTVYVLPEEPYSPDELVVTLNGVARTDYTLVGGNVTFVGQNTTGQVFDARYRY